MTLETEILAFISQYRTPILTELMLSITALGSTATSLIILAITYSQGEKQLFQKLSAGLLLTWAIVYPIKMLVARPRPETIVSEVVSLTNSFPSGHAATAFLTATVLSENINSKLIYTIAVLIAISRVYLGAHFPSDVLVGASIGIITGKMVINKEVQIKLSETMSSTLS